jgi:membrane protease YdiL (CAAX protease family)
MRAKYAPRIVFSNPTKIREILLVFLVVQFFWHAVFATFFTNIVNAEYLQWAATAVSMIWFSKLVLTCVGSNFESFIGSPPHANDLPELFVVALFSVMLGIGCWAGLVIIEANIDAEWTWSKWQLLPPGVFGRNDWVSQWIVVNLLTGSVVVPITEEIVFRGFILNRLRKQYGVALAVIVSSLIFAAFHYNKSFVGSFAHGIVFAVLAVRFSSLYAPILVHGLYNASVDLLSVHFGMFMTADRARIASAGYWSAELSCLAAAAIFFFVYLRRVTSRLAKPVQLVENG